MEYIPAKHLLHRTQSTEWFGTDHTINLYRGCCHGCIYCDSRSSCYQNAEFDTVKAKTDALRILRDDLARKVLPFLEDSEENAAAIAAVAAEAGAKFVYAAFGVTLRDCQRQYFYQQLEKTFPKQGLAERYRARYGMQYQCPSPKAGQLWEVFSKECQRLGLLCNMRHIVSAATRPYADRQLTFF